MSSYIGQSIGRYRILEQLGEGGMATVYKAYDSRLEREVAVKVIRVEQFAPAVLERVLKRFEREARTLAKVSHPNIVKVIDYGEQDNTPYLVMPYIPGGTLRQQVKQGAVPWQDAVHLIIPIAQALDYAHRHGVIHRDIKPSNILLTQAGEPMLSDFGVAKMFEMEGTVDLTGTGMGVGTPEYMSPEQWTGQATSQSDVYSLGVVFYELITGRKPYMADTPAAIMLKQATEPLPRPAQFASGVPVNVERVVFRALARRPEDRYRTMGDFAVALGKLGSDGAEKNELPTSDELSEPELSNTTRQQPSRDKLYMLKKPLVLLPILGVLAVSVLLFLGFSNLIPLAETPSPVVPTEVFTPTFTVTPTNSLTPTIQSSPTPKPTLAPTAFGGGGKIGFVSNQTGQDEVYLFLLDTNEIKSLTNKDLVPYGLGVKGVAWSPDGNRVAFFSGYNTNDQLFTLNTDGTNLVPIMQGSFPTWQSMSWSSDSKSIYYTTNSGYLYRINYDGTGSKLQPNMMSQLTWSRDGSKLAFYMVLENDVCSIFHTDIGESYLTQFSNRKGYCSPFTWSLTGESLFYIFGEAGNRDARSSLYEINLDGSNDRKIVSFDFYPSYMTLSPDGTKLLFSNSRHRLSNDWVKFGLYVVNTDGSDLVRLTERSSDFATWSPDGTKILFISPSSPGYYDLFIMNSDGTDIRNITNQPAEYRDIVWLP